MKNNEQSLLAETNDEPVSGIGSIKSDKIGAHFRPSAAPCLQEIICFFSKTVIFPESLFI
jgi:hypothetical protein